MIMKKMVPITILDNEFVTLWYHPDTKIVHHQFHKFLHGQPFRDALNAGLEVLRKYGAQKWLSDDRHNMALPQKDLAWARTDWFPRVQAAGWKYWAVVQPENALGELNVQRAVKASAEQGVIVKFFSDPAEALIWLENQ